MSSYVIGSQFSLINALIEIRLKQKAWKIIDPNALPANILQTNVLLFLDIFYLCPKIFLLKIFVCMIAVGSVTQMTSFGRPGNGCQFPRGNLLLVLLFV